MSQLSKHLLPVNKELKRKLWPENFQEELKMNERIKELAEQAEGTKKHVPAVWQFYDHELEKFAELIIRESAAQCLSDDCMRILNHFGVKWS